MELSTRAESNGIPLVDAGTDPKEIRNVHG